MNDLGTRIRDLVDQSAQPIDGRAIVRGPNRPNRQQARSGWIVGLAAGAVILIVGTLTFAARGGQPERPFINSTEAPSRSAEVVVYFATDLDQVSGELIAIDVARWDGVEFVAFWDVDRSLDEFASRYEDSQPELVQKAHESRLTFPTSLRIWVRADGERNSVAERARTELSTATLVNGRGVGGFPYEYAVALVGNALDPAVVDTLGDDVVTDAEMQASLDGFLSCVEAAGVVAEAHLDANNRSISIDLEIDSNRDSEFSERVSQRCGAMNLNWVLDFWIATDPNREARIERARQLRIRCLNEQGLDIPADTEWDDLVSPPPGTDPGALLMCEVLPS